MSSPNQFKDFSLYNQKITIERYVGALVEGVYTRTLDSTFEVWASPQPYRTIAPQLLDDATRGEYLKKTLVIFLSVLVYVNEEASPNNYNDFIIVNGRKYEPLSVEEWGFLNQQHYRVIARVYDGD